MAFRKAQNLLYARKALMALTKSGGNSIGVLAHNATYYYSTNNLDHSGRRGREQTSRGLVRSSERSVFTSGKMSRYTPQEKHESHWFLERTVDGGKSFERIPIQTFPFRVGRLEGIELTLARQSISKHHAEIVFKDGSLLLRDLSSTNGTFVNRERVTVATLQEGDIVHFAEFEFRVGRQTGEGEAALTKGPGLTTFILGPHELSRQFVGGMRELTELLERELTTAVFQPIVSIPQGDLVAYEVLGRGRHEDLPSSPAALFQVAEAHGRAAELSRLFRTQAATLVQNSGANFPLLFLNTHPSEIDDPGLIDSLRQVREIAPGAKLALEIHEGALAEPTVISKLKRQLDELEIHLALDDFGIGERFLQLAEVPPRFLKFDMSLVKDIVEATSFKRRLVSMLLAAAREIRSRDNRRRYRNWEGSRGLCDDGLRFRAGLPL